MANDITEVFTTYLIVNQPPTQSSVNSCSTILCWKVQLICNKLNLVNYKLCTTLKLHTNLMHYRIRVQLAP